METLEELDPTGLADFLLLLDMNNPCLVLQ